VRDWREQRAALGAVVLVILVITAIALYLFMPA
jgi:hypothetical protein